MQGRVVRVLIDGAYNLFLRPGEAASTITAL
jgi:hypothetical protein